MNDNQDKNEQDKSGVRKPFFSKATKYVGGGSIIGALVGGVVSHGVGTIVGVLIGGLIGNSLLAKTNNDNKND